LKSQIIILGLFAAVNLLSGCTKGATDASGASSGPTWHSPSGLADYRSLSAQDANNNHVGIDANGNVIHAWMGDDGTNNEIYKAVYHNGTWTSPSGVNDNVSLGATSIFEFSLAVSSGGDAVIAWVASDGSNLRVYKSEYRSGVWTKPANLADAISPSGQDAGTNVSTAMDSSGNAIIVWAEFDGAKTQIYKSEYRSGAWTHPANLADNISPDGFNVAAPSVAMDNNGNAIISWLQDHNGGPEYMVFKSEYRSGAWTHPSSITDFIQPAGTMATTLQAPAVAMDNNGNAIIVWIGSDGTWDQTFKSEYRSGAWTHPASASDNISPNGNNVSAVTAAMSSSGRALILTTEGDGTASRIFKSEYSNGAWVHPIGLTDVFVGTDVYTNIPDLKMNASGEAIFTYVENDSNGDIQTYLGFYRNGAWTLPGTLSDHPSFAGHPSLVGSVAINSAGGAALTFGEIDGTHYRSFVGLFY
jgi:mRNA-degrading endonuclease HigB of HigAB toxin-antitoxin module